MSALTTIFNHILGYLYFFIGIVFQANIDLTDVDKYPFKVVAYQMAEQLSSWYPDGLTIPVYLVFLSIGIFAVGSIISLVRRLFR